MVSFEKQVGWTTRVILSPGAHLPEEAKAVKVRCEAAGKVTEKHWCSTLGRQMGKILQEQMPEMESKTRMRSQSENEDKRR